jgi:hypothetical protein
MSKELLYTLLALALLAHVWHMASRPSKVTRAQTKKHRKQVVQRQRELLRRWHEDHDARPKER